ncbi:hypothetical protein [Pelagibacterium sp. H642]|uniref:hypothetical protein n=1 Tax=Pelagibacterium sp. H642 TaxID=1881069 RepID=UPI0028159450|nr:hypothetical protein [Pelagibacterium sp. H642]WMT91907.1 hypothetical protein NO934_06500 [Pelagibacterium sp. H642]
MPRDGQPNISKFARAGGAVWLDGPTPGVILAVDGEYCLVRSRRETNGATIWSDPFWIEAYSGPLVGTPPAKEAEIWQKEVASLADRPYPARPKSKRATGLQGDLFW